MYNGNNRIIPYCSSCPLASSLCNNQKCPLKKKPRIWIAQHLPVVSSYMCCAAHTCSLVLGWWRLASGVARAEEPEYFFYFSGGALCAPP